MSVTTAGLQFDFVPSNAASGANGFFFKSNKDAFYYDIGSSTLTKVTDVDYPATTVPGAAYLDGYFFVMDANGVIHNSDLEAPLSWNSLNFISCEAEPDGGAAIAKYQNYIVGFGEWTTEFFYDAANATGSPLARIENAAIQIGCANGYSATQFDDKLVWIGKSREKGRGVYALTGGMSPTKVSTPDVDRILNADDLVTVYAWGAGFNGHPLYVLTLGTSSITLVYDFATQAWSHFTRRKAQAPKSVSSITQSNGIATVVFASAHGWSDGDPVTIAGATPAGYNGAVNVSYVDSLTVSYECDSSLTTPATGTITATGSTESYFDLAYYVNAGGHDMVQGASDGIIYEMLSNTYTDDSQPIDANIRTIPFDGSTAKIKSCGSAEVIGDKVSSNAFVRYSNDDYATNSPYRRVDMSLKRSRLSRLGSFSRRSFEIRHTAATSFRVEALEIEVE